MSTQTAAPVLEKSASVAGMTLELASYDVRDIVLGTETALRDGVLSIDAGVLRAHLLRDNEWIGDVSVALAHPGDSVRIIHIVDAVEPRTRISEPGTDFPGMLGVPRTVGSGRTNRLNGVAVVEVAEPVPGEPTYWREAIADMSGEGARYTPFSQLHNVVLTFTPKADRFSKGEEMQNIMTGTTEAEEYGKAVRIAGLRAAIYLAEATRNLEPDRLEVLSLDDERAQGLPAVAYAYQIQSPFIYGEVAPAGGAIHGPGHLPTIIHPNEILDGALVNSFTVIACMREVTYAIQNHAIVKELYANHGKTLDFRGVVLYTNGDSVTTKERISAFASNLVVLLGADGAILNYLGGGHPIVDVMMTCEKLEKRGVKTTLMLMEMAVNPEDSGHVHYVRQADAIVSTGNYEQLVQLAPVKTVLGGTNILESGEDASGSFSIALRNVLASTSQFGGGRLRGRGF